MRIHPLAEIFPLIEGQAFDELVASIKENGLREPIIVFDDAILDGRNRFRACEAAGVTPSFETYTGKDPARFVVDRNINRRHLTESDRGMVAARLVTWKLGQNQYVKEGGSIDPPSGTLVQAANMLNVGRATVVRARRILDQGTPEEIESVETGNASVSGVADKISKRTPKKLSKPKKTNLSDVGGNVARIQNMRIKQEIWGHLKGALEHLTNLPQVEDAVAVARSMDRHSYLDKRLTRATKYLREFENAWNSKDPDYDGHAGNGYQPSGDEQTESAA